MKNTGAHEACTNREFALAELVDGTLGRSEADELQRHLESCPRCRSALAEYRAIDARLGDALAPPLLEPGFEARLRERIAEIAVPEQESRMRRTVLASQEHERLTSALGQLDRRALLLNSVATASAGAALWLLVTVLASRFETLLPALGAGERIVTLGTLGTVLAACSIVWAAMRGLVPRLRLGT
jgi:anti-sigma factor RsiW